MRNNITKQRLGGMVLSPFGDIGTYANHGFGDFQVLSDGSIAGLGFKNSWTYDDWTSANHKWSDHIAYWFKLNYVPLDSTILSRANAKIGQMADAAKAGSSQADGLLLQLTTPIKVGIAAADKNTSQFDNLGNASDATHADRFRIFNELNAAITKLANATIPTVWSDLDTGGATAPGGADAGTPTGIYQTLAKNNANAAAAAAAAKAAADAARNAGMLSNASALPGSDNTLMYVAAGVGGLLLIGGVIVMMKGKKASS